MVTSTTLLPLLTLPNVTLPLVCITSVFNVPASTVALSLVVSVVKWLACVGESWLET